MLVKFWVVTPSFNSLKWLPCAVASVADQAGVGIEVHHHVQDGRSEDGTCEWLKEYAAECARNPRGNYSFSFEIAPDKGMYDAINNGWAKAPLEADFLAHLNSDEQYLPDALRTVAEWFSQHPKMEVFLGDTIVVNPEGRYICHRRSIKPSWLIFHYNCGGLTAATFQRAAVFQKRGILFDAQWRVIADKIWYCDLFDAGVTIGCCNRLVSVFAETGKNLGWTAAFLEEAHRYDTKIRGISPIWVWGVGKWVAFKRILLEKKLEPPKSYSIYTPEHPEHRVGFSIKHTTGLWRKKQRT